MNSGVAIHWACYRALQASQDPRAQGVLTKAYRMLLDWADKIDEEKWRRSFLENVPAHREILAEYERTRTSDSGSRQRN